MSVPVKIINAFRSKHIPDRYLSVSSNEVLEMFSNQICVSLEATYTGFPERYAVEDEIRAMFLEKIFNWTEQHPTEGRWSIVSHGTTDFATGEYKSLFGFLFEIAEDAERFLKHFIIIEKLTV